MASQSNEGQETANNGKNPPLISYLAEAKKENQWIPKAPFEILNKYGSHMRRFRRGNIIHRPVPQIRPCGTFGCQELPSAEAIVGVAKTRLLQETSQKTDDLSSLNFCPRIPSKNTKNVELIFHLLNAAEKFSNREFDCADRLISKCILYSAPADSPVERVVKHFSKALRERVDRERGKIDLERTTFQLKETLLTDRPGILTLAKKLPASQITQFTVIQAILDTVGNAKKIHLVDFGIKSGLHWSMLMHDLANRETCKLELLKITAVGTSKDKLNETCGLLSSFADSMSLPFSHKAVVSEVTGLKKDLFEFQDDEAMAVYSGLQIRSELAWPNHLRSFIKFVTKLKPCVLVVNEIEASTNMASFTERFHAALSYNIAVFDCLQTCLKGENIYREIVEGVFFKDMIRNIVIAEDEERTHRHAKLGIWRLFGEFGMVETEFSQSCLDQAKLLLKKNACWDFCTLDMDGKCMVVGWKGTPLRSVSAWKVADELQPDPISD